MKKKQELRKKKKKSGFLPLKIIFALVLYLSLVFSIAKAQQKADFIMPELVQRGRQGSPVSVANPEKKPFNGVRSVANPNDYYNYAANDAAIERISDIDITGSSNRSQLIDSVTEQWKVNGLADKEVNILQAIGLSSIYLPQADVDAKVIEESFNKPIKSLKPSDMPFLATNPFTTDLLFRSQALGEQAEAKTVASTVVDPTGNFPLLAGERNWGSNNSSNTPSQNQYLIQQNATSTTNLARLTQEAPWNAILNNPYPNNPGSSASSPTKRQPSFVSPASEQKKANSTLLPGQNAGGIGQSLVLNDAADPNNEPLFNDYLNQMLLDDLANRINQNNQQLQDFNNFFGNNLNGLQDGFGDLGSLLNGFTPPGSGSGSPVQNIDNQTPPADSPNPDCSGETQHYTSGEAKAIAAIIGLPLNTMSTWRTIFVPKSSIINNDRIGKKSDDSTLKESDFPSGEKCVWSVVSTKSDPIEAAFIEDVRSTSGAKILVIIQ